MPLNRNNDEQGTETVLFMWKRCPTLFDDLTEKQIRGQCDRGQISIDRMAENYFAIRENTKRCKGNQKGYDLINKTEVKSAATSRSGRKSANVMIKISGLKHKENSHHIMAIVYNDVLSKTQVLKITKGSIIYAKIAKGKTQYGCGVNKETGDLNGLQKYVIDEG